MQDTAALMFNIGYELKHARLSKKHTISLAAEALGVSVRTLQYIEKGENPLLAHYLNYAAWLEIDFAAVVKIAQMRCEHSR